VAEVVTQLERLREVALDQHGFVTTAQALAAGVSDASLAMMVRRGRLARVAHGVYRVPQVPVTQYDPFMLAVLWTGAGEACLSHDTALAAWEISDINPTAIHLTVAKHRRIKRVGGEGYVLHRENLVPKQLTWWHEIPIVTIPTTIEQCIRTGVATYLVRQAIERATSTGDLLGTAADRLTKELEHRHGP
jgi:predicted transcriptional regulator of viral defense system